VERDVEFLPTKTPYDPRHMLAGTTAADGKWVPGFFDRNSFMETLGGWGKSVVTGRAKLGTWLPITVSFRIGREQGTETCERDELGE
jgi:acetyl-CoA carboxylase carboxyltransferase component